MRSSLLLFIVSVLAGCGGKIVETAPIPDETMPFEKPSKTEPPSSTVPDVPSSPPAPATVTSLDACNVLCERDARCDTTLPALPAKDGDSGRDCESRCEDRLAGKCGVDDWLLCYASRITPDVCTPLPDECRPAFCAWARCAKQPVSNCN